MNKKLLLVAIILLLIAIESYAETSKVTLNSESGGTVGLELKIPLGKQYDYNNIKCTKVVDGDTIELENGEKVRMIGIDTPESRNNSKTKRDSERTGQDIKTITLMGKKATEFTKTLVEGKQVRLEFDVQERDRYGRLLAYIYLTDGTFVNVEIVKSGYASPMTIPPCVKYAELFKRLYEEAMETKRGLWE
ncbi:MAG: thermonuclease [PVC group bacterium]|nr:thermonuclease [PVC group bacterium]